MVAETACEQLDADQRLRYRDYIHASLSELAMRKLQGMKPVTYEPQFELFKSWFSEGRTEGRAEGKVEGKAEGKKELILRQLALRFGALDTATHSRIENASADELDAISERCVTAQTLEQAVGLR